MSEYTRGLVVGKFCPLHRGHQLVIDTALAACDHVTVMTWANPEPSEMPAAVRERWIRTLYPDVEVLAFGPDEVPHDDAPDAEQRAFTKSKLPVPVDAVFTSESYGPGLAEVLGCAHVAVDPGRPRVPTSGTAIRADVHAHRHQLDPRVYAHFIELVAAYGAESSGKSTLMKALAKTYETAYVEEYGRTLWEARGGDLPLADYVEIVEGHRQLEEAALLKASRYVFVDTNAITTQQYAFFFHGTCPPRVIELANQCRDRYDVSLLCAPDIPFEQDGTRVHPQVQQYMDGAIRNDLTIRGIPYTVVTGSVEERVAQVRRVLG
ncbi:MAG: AAA family ATPase [Bacteroidota bacterium]